MPLPRVARRGPIVLYVDELDDATAEAVRFVRSSPATASRRSTSATPAASRAPGALQRDIRSARRASPQRHGVGHGRRLGERGRASAGRDHDAGRARALHASGRSSPRCAAVRHSPCGCVSRASATSSSPTCRSSRVPRAHPSRRSSGAGGRPCCSRSPTTMPRRAGRSSTRSGSAQPTCAACTSRWATTTRMPRRPSGRRALADPRRRRRVPLPRSRRSAARPRSARSRPTRTRSAWSCCPRSSARTAGSGSCTTSAGSSSSACCCSRSA